MTILRITISSRVVRALRPFFDRSPCVSGAEDVPVSQERHNAILIGFDTWEVILSSRVTTNALSVGIQVSCSAGDNSVVRNGRFPVSKYSKASLYIT